VGQKDPLPPALAPLPSSSAPCRAVDASRGREKARDAAKGGEDKGEGTGGLETGRMALVLALLHLHDAGEGGHGHVAFG
jgi:hypothetical protein